MTGANSYCFSPKTLAFLADLAANNSKPWFEAHRAVYREHLLTPFQELVGGLSGPMLEIDPAFETRPAVDRTISRLHRDTRFSRDKSPYKSTVWLTFKRPRPDWQDCPAYFFELAPRSYRFGMGFFAATKGTMDRLRGEIDRKPDAVRERLAPLGEQTNFLPQGESYKRTLNGEVPTDLYSWYQRKNLYLVCNRPVDGRLFGRELATELAAGFHFLAPFYHWFWQLKSG